MDIEKNVLLIRYSNYYGIDTIKEHVEVIEKYGYCWFGKFGKKPSESYINKLMKDGSIYAFLYTRGVLHLGKIIDVSYEKPREGCPDYYLSRLYGTDMEPVIYFKLTMLQEENVGRLDDYLVPFSGKEAMYTLNKSLSSYIVIRHKDATQEPKKEKVKRVRKEKAIVDKSTCMYRKDGLCDNKRCINYQYECMHPNLCTKQKNA